MGHERGPVVDRGGPGLLVEIDRAGELPLHEQIESGLRERIRSGQLPSDMRLPSTRVLAHELGVSRGVVTEAYGQLAAEGYLAMSQGAPVRVATVVRAASPRPPARSLLESFAYHFHPGLPDLAGFPRETWLRSVRAALRDSPHAALGYGDPRGVPELREALCDYLGRVRGMDADPEHTLVCTGFMQGFSLICRALARRGVERVALEDPGWHVHRLIVESAGLQVVPIPVDGQGLRVDELEKTDAAAVLVTSAHQFPTGAVLGPDRRAALIEWAEEERLIIEDDYDAEYRYDRAPVPALQASAPGQVAYAGSTSKTLAPGLRLGWLIPPDRMRAGLIEAKHASDLGSPALPQLVLAQLIASGELEQHIRGVRKRQRHRRDALLHALREHLPQARVQGVAAGLHLLITFPERAGTAGRYLADTTLAERILEAGVLVHPLSWHRQRPGPAGLVLGYAAHTPDQLRQAARRIAGVLASARS